MLSAFSNHDSQLWQNKHVFGKKNILHDIMTTCIILHNMIIEDERDLNAPIEDVREAPASEVERIEDETMRFNQFIARHAQIKDKDVRNFNF